MSATKASTLPGHSELNSAYTQDTACSPPWPTACANASPAEAPWQSCWVADCMHTTAEGGGRGQQQPEQLRASSQPRVLRELQSQGHCASSPGSMQPGMPAEETQAILPQQCCHLAGNPLSRKHLHSSGKHAMRYSHSFAHAISITVATMPWFLRSKADWPPCTQQSSPRCFHLLQYVGTVMLTNPPVDVSNVVQ